MNSVEIFYEEYLKDEYKDLSDDQIQTLATEKIELPFFLKKVFDLYEYICKEEKRINEEKLNNEEKHLTMLKLVDGKKDLKNTFKFLDYKKVYFNSLYEWIDKQTKEQTLKKPN